MMQSTSTLIGIALFFSLTFAGCIGQPPSISSQPIEVNVTVAVIGSSSEGMAHLFNRTEFRSAGVRYAGGIDPKVVFPRVLHHFSVIILNVDSECSQDVQKIIADKVAEGGRLVVLGAACASRPTQGTPEWKTPLESIMPVIPEFGQDVYAVQSGATHTIDAPSHPIAEGVSSFSFEEPFVPVALSPHATLIASITPYAGGTDNKSPAIAERTGLPKGKVIYFAYDPFTLPEEKASKILLNTLRYLAK